MPKEKDKDKDKDKEKKRFKLFGLATLAIGIVFCIFSAGTTVDKSEAANDALKNKVSTKISAGAVLLTADEEMTSEDPTIVHNSKEDKTKIWVWDYAAEDGDYVQVLVDGTPISESFMIKNKPREFTVPTVGEIQVKGIRDGGGGITYAIRYEMNSTTYFNGTPEGEANTYTLIRE